MDLHINPAPRTPAPGFTTRLATLQAYLDAEVAEDGFHGQVTLTGRTHVDAEDGALWYEITFDAGCTAWVSWDVEPDPRAPLGATPTAITGWVDEL